MTTGHVSSDGSVLVVLRRLAVVTAVLAGLLFMHAFLANRTGPDTDPMPATATAMEAVVMGMGEPATASDDHRGSNDHRGHDGLHIAGLCLAVLLAGAVILIGPRRLFRFVPAVDGPAARTLTARLVGRPKRPPGLTELCVSIC